MASLSLSLVARSDVLESACHVPWDLRLPFETIIQTRCAGLNEPALRCRYGNAYRCYERPVEYDALDLPKAAEAGSRPRTVVAKVGTLALGRARHALYRSS